MLSACLCWQSAGLRRTPVRCSWSSFPIRSMYLTRRGNLSRFGCRTLRRRSRFGPRACWSSLRGRLRSALNFLKGIGCCWFTTAPPVLGRELPVGCWGRFRSLIRANPPGSLRRVPVGIRSSFRSRNLVSRCSGSRKPTNGSCPSRLQESRMNIMSGEWFPKGKVFSPLPRTMRLMRGRRCRHTCISVVCDLHGQRIPIRPRRVCQRIVE